MLTVDFKYKYIILLGHPGAGKSYVVNKLQSDLGYFSINFGAVIRKRYMLTKDPRLAVVFNGQMIDDDLSCKILGEELNLIKENKLSCAIDGFPRSLYQAKYLFDSIDLASVFCIFLEVSFEKSLERISKRRICCNCQCLEDTCSCKNALFLKRTDDELSIVKERYEKSISTINDVVSYVKRYCNVHKIPTDNCIKEDSYRQVYSLLTRE